MFSACLIIKRMRLKFGRNFPVMQQKWWFFKVIKILKTWSQQVKSKLLTTSTSMLVFAHNRNVFEPQINFNTRATFFAPIFLYNKEVLQKTSKITQIAQRSFYFLFLIARNFWSTKMDILVVKEEKDLNNAFLITFGLRIKNLRRWTHTEFLTNAW